MPSTKDLRDRIRSISNTAKVTGAMQLIAASKMNRAQLMVENGRPYSEHMKTVLSNLSGVTEHLDETADMPLLKIRSVNKILMLFITPDRGLAGSLVANLTKMAASYISESEALISVVGVGKKGQRFIARAGQDLFASYSVPDRASLDDTTSISKMLINEYQNGNFDKVIMIHAKFINTASQKTTVTELLPISSSNNENEKGEYIYEPDPIYVLNALIPKYIEVQVYHALLEGFASEHSARMIAMKNATDNANELIDELTLDLNKARQEAITSELLDIVGGVAALEI